jgi:hypothetical protein
MMVRKMYVPKCEQEVWKIRRNLKLQNAHKSPNIVTKIKIKRPEWLGNVIRMENIRIQKMMILNAKSEGRRGVGRPKLRW